MLPARVQRSFAFVVCALFSSPTTTITAAAAATEAFPTLLCMGYESITLSTI